MALLVYYSIVTSSLILVSVTKKLEKEKNNKLVMRMIRHIMRRPRDNEDDINSHSDLKEKLDDSIVSESDTESAYSDL